MKNKRIKIFRKMDLKNRKIHIKFWIVGFALNIKVASDKSIWKTWIKLLNYVFYQQHYYLINVLTHLKLFLRIIFNILPIFLFTALLIYVIVLLLIFSFINGIKISIWSKYFVWRFMHRIFYNLRGLLFI